MRVVWIRLSAHLLASRLDKYAKNETRCRSRAVSLIAVIVAQYAHETSYLSNNMLIAFKLSLLTINQWKLHWCVSLTPSRIANRSAFRIDLLPRDVMKPFSHPPPTSRNKPPPIARPLDLATATSVLSFNQQLGCFDNSTFFVV